MSGNDEKKNKGWEASTWAVLTSPSSFPPMLVPSREVVVAVVVAIVVVVAAPVVVAIVAIVTVVRLMMLLCCISRCASLIVPTGAVDDVPYVVCGECWRFSRLTL